MATDALEVLKTGVGASDCGGFDPCVCDVNGSATVSASDALLVLQRAVGQNVVFSCPCGSSTTSTTIGPTTTTMPGQVQTTALSVLTKRASTYTTADLAGTWDASTLASGPDTPWWSRGAITIQSDGNFAGSLTGSDGSTEPISGELAVSSLGVVTCTSGCQPGFQGALDADKRLVAATDTWFDGTTELLLFTKRAPSYALTDLAGTWELNTLQSMLFEGGWSRGTLTITADGSVSGTTVDSDGDVDVIASETTLSPSGEITCLNGCEPDLRGALDLSKTVAVLTETLEDGAGDLIVLSRKGMSYAQADLTGTWAIHSLAAGYDAPWWIRGSMIVQANGSISGTLTNSDGGMSSVEGTLTIDADGYVTISGDDEFRCAMESSRTIAICTDTW